jgi:UDP-glucose 4-epimerase
VSDLADAHLAALDRLARRQSVSHEVFNIGTGHGSSVREMVESILRVSGSTARPEVLPRRAGDPAIVVADPTRAMRELGWSPRHGLEDIVESAWQAHRLLGSFARR